MSTTQTPPAALPLRFLWREALVLVLVLAAQHGPSAVGALTLLLLVGWALRNNRAAMQALTISVLLAYLNPALTAPHSMTSALKWLLLFAVCAISVARTYRLSRVPRWLIALALFAVVVGILALVTSAQAGLSLFKLASFTVGVIAALTVFHGASQSPGYARDWLYTVAAVVLVVSLPMLAFSAGYLPGTHMFRGMLVHSQAYGIYLAPMVMFLLARVLTGESTAVSELLVLAGGVLTVVMTGSRTSVLAALGAALIIGLLLVVRTDLRRVFARGRALAVLAVLAAGGLLLLVTAHETVQRQSMRFFLAKNRTSAQETLTPEEAFTSSRGGLIDQSLSDFRQQPLAGVGFGMASAGVVVMVSRDPYLGLPISAPVEQGFLPTATIGQIGIIGTALLLIFLGGVFGPIIRSAPLPILALCLTAFLVNFGEMIIYSTGGMGLQMWLLLGCCLEESRRQRGTSCV